MMIIAMKPVAAAVTLTLAATAPAAVGWTPLVSTRASPTQHGVAARAAALAAMRRPPSALEARRQDAVPPSQPSSPKPTPSLLETLPLDITDSSLFTGGGGQTGQWLFFVPAGRPLC